MNKRGFTLIELLIVISIVGILAAIGLVALNGSRERARDAQRKHDISSFRSSLALYFEGNDNVYPDSFTIANTNGVVEVSGSLTSATANALVPDFMSSLPMPPLNGDTYVYLSGGTLDQPEYRLYTTVEGQSQGAIYWLSQSNSGFTGLGTVTCAPGLPCTP
jgi:prepilin-type N-terminal cleavage/methylation domain-containing protein